MRGRIIGKIEGGRKITDVAREFDIAHSVVSRLCKSFKTTGMCSRRHGEVVLEDCLDSEGIQRLVWPVRSLDLNPIENVWDALGRQVAGRNYPPTNKNTLSRALTEEWDKLPQQLLDNVVQSMVRRVKCCITLHGGHIPY
ncbi:transposable element Tcb1 transposase [Trichonephila clavipes]|nr:transposable element Tcb1 transposase [Trichonephila clavipes]